MKSQSAQFAADPELERKSQSDKEGVKARALAVLPANLRHLGLRAAADADRGPEAAAAADIETIQDFTRKYYVESFKTFELLGALAPDGILHYVRNVVSEASPRTPLCPPGFKGALYSPQAAVLQRMLELEREPPTLTKPNIVLRVNAGILRERCAFGKTFLLTALAAQAVVEQSAETAANPNLVRVFASVDDEGPRVPATVIVCSGRIAADLADAFKRTTDLSCVRVATAASLDAVAARSGEGRPAVYIVKDGVTTWRGEGRSTLEHFVAATSGWAGLPPVFDRLVFDDYDMLKIKPDVLLPLARFCWLTSATDATNPSGKMKKHSFGRLLDQLPILNACSEVSCSTDFSALEFNLPRPQFWRVNFPAVDVAAALALGNPVAAKECEPECRKVFFAGGGVVPPASAPKVLFCSSEPREEREEWVAELAARGVSALLLTKGNANRFAREPIAVGVAGLLHGVNMGYLTHIVVDDDDFTSAEVAQIVGRGQRVGRAASLQVYLASAHNREYEESDGEEEDEDYDRADKAPE